MTMNSIEKKFVSILLGVSSLKKMRPRELVRKIVGLLLTSFVASLPPHRKPHAKHIFRILEQFGIFQEGGTGIRPKGP